MTKPKRPAKRYFLKWEPKAWREDKALQSCHITTRGIWHELCLVMHDCEPYGHLVIAGASPDHAAIARLVGSTPTEAKRAIAELEAKHVSSRTSAGLLYSRRMVKDEAAYQAACAAGAKGGNPSLVSEPLEDGITPGDNTISNPPEGSGGQGITGGDNQDLRARPRANASVRDSEFQKGNSSSSSHLNEAHSSLNARARDEAQGKTKTGTPRAPNEHDAFWAWWCERYAQLTSVPSMTAGARYPDNPGEHSKANEVLRLARHSGSGLEIAKQQAERFFAHATFGKEAPTLGRLVSVWPALFEAKAATPKTSTGAGQPPISADERAVEKAWLAKHDTDLVVPTYGGGTRVVRGPDRKYPGYAEAKAELEQDAKAKKESA